ncbi:hypothetical protein [Cupriavidus sp. SK-4]|uniref:hypothetical protein n=1 Tax=Cupriavidus sp. SK-4 TaxID=574750 RepID=UPI0026F3FDF7|nr:hypothetical protein [Cupriavidus sp. SK-4]
MLIIDALEVVDIHQQQRQWLVATTVDIHQRLPGFLADPPAQSESAIFRCPRYLMRSGCGWSVRGVAQPPISEYFFLHKDPIGETPL